MKYISFFCQAISIFCLCFFITYYFIFARLISLFCQAYFIVLPGLFHFFARAHFISLPKLISFLAMPICLAMMGSISKTCDLLFASIYMLIVQLTYIMTSNANKYKYNPNLVKKKKNLTLTLKIVKKWNNLWQNNEISLAKQWNRPGKTMKYL